MPILKAAATYFALVFGVGFLLGCVRVPLLVPRVGVRTAELIEAPFMLLAIVLAARWITRAFPGSRAQHIAVGVLAGFFLLLAELLVGVIIGGVSVWDVFFDRDPVSGAVYYGLVVLFVVMPALYAQTLSAGIIKWHARKF